MSRPLVMLGVGLAVTTLVVASITPVGAYGLEVVLPMFAVIAVGLVITLVAGVKGKRAERDGELAEQSRLLHSARPSTSPSATSPSATSPSSTSPSATSPPARPPAES